MPKIFDSIQTQILSSHSILLITHQKPDGDACGSILAMLHYLELLDKNVTAYVPDPAPSYFSFLPGFEKLTSDQNILGLHYDTIILLDCASFKQATINPEKFSASVIINIDHHWTNPLYGDFNAVQEKASSTCEVVYDFFKNINYDLDQPIAVCLLNGILADTGAFSNSATSSEAMAIAGKLIQKGAKIHKINDQVTKTHSLYGLRLWGKVLSRLKINKTYSIAHTYITQEEIRQENVSEEEIDGLVNFLNSLSDAEVVMVLKIGPTIIKGSFRTKSDKINVADLAAVFGGGGHKKAAGFTVNWQAIEKNGELVIL